MNYGETQDILENLRTTFRLQANPKDASAMGAYMKNIAPYYGLKSATRRELQKEVLANWIPNWQALLFFTEESWQNDEREWQYCGIETLWKFKKIWPLEAINLFERLIITKSWWDTVDTLASTHCGHYFKMHPEKISDIIPDWIASENMWLNRSAMLFQLKYGEKTNVSLLQQTIIPHLTSKEFFHQKAIGWVLRQYARTNPEWVLEFVHNNTLKPLSKREALKHLK